MRRHKKNHLIVDLSDIHATMEQAREEALAKVREKELEETKTEIANTISCRLEQIKDVFEQLKILREHAADLLDRDESSDDLRSAGTFLKELREDIKLMGELEGKLQTQPPVDYYQ